MNKDEFKNQMLYDTNKIPLTNEETRDIIKQTIVVTDLQKLNLFSGAKNAIIACEEISELILELQYFMTKDNYDSIDLLEELADIIISLEFLAQCFGCTHYYDEQVIISKALYPMKNIYTMKERTDCIADTIMALCKLQKIIIKNIRGCTVQYDDTTDSILITSMQIYKLCIMLNFKEDVIKCACDIKSRRQEERNKKGDSNKWANLRVK